MITEAEFVVMEALWRRSPLAAEDIIAEIAAAQNWTPATVRTLLNRLLVKGAIEAQRDVRRYLYRPLLSRSDYLSTESQGFVDRLFDGRIGPLVSHFSEQRKLTREDIEELKRLIEEIDGGS